MVGYEALKILILKHIDGHNYRKLRQFMCLVEVVRTPDRYTSMMYEYLACPRVLKLVEILPY